MNAGEHGKGVAERTVHDVPKLEDLIGTSQKGHLGHKARLPAHQPDRIFQFRVGRWKEAEQCPHVISERPG